NRPARIRESQALSAAHAAVSAQEEGQTTQVGSLLHHGLDEAVRLAAVELVRLVEVIGRPLDPGAINARQVLEDHLRNTREGSTEIDALGFGLLPEFRGQRKRVRRGWRGSFRIRPKEGGEQQREIRQGRATSHDFLLGEWLVSGKTGARFYLRTPRWSKRQ